MDVLEYGLRYLRLGSAGGLDGALDLWVSQNCLSLCLRGHDARDGSR